MSASAVVSSATSPAVEKLKESLTGDLVVPGDEDYEWGIKRWAAQHIVPARYIVYPKTNEDIAKALQFRKDLDLELGVCCGGHSWSGASATRGLLIHLGKYMNNVRCDPEKQLLYVQGGALWGDVDKEAIKYGLATVAGAVSDTGVGGLALGGGYGWLTGKHGLVVDNTVQYTVVLASGEVVTANETENPDLFWGLRGGGSNFGIVTEFVFKAHPQRPTVFLARLIFPVERAHEVASTALKWYEGITEDEALLVFQLSAPPTFHPMIMVMYYFNGEAEQGRQSIKSLFDLGPIQQIVEDAMPYEKLNTIQNEQPKTRAYMKGVSFPKSKLTPELVVKAYELSRDTHNRESGFGYHAMAFELFAKQNMLKVPTSATAFGDRTESVELLMVLGNENPALDGAQRDEVRGWADKFSSWVQTTGKGYANYEADVTKGTSNIFGENYPRLQQVKAKYDPECIFNRWFPIKPSSA